MKLQSLKIMLLFGAITLLTSCGGGDIMGGSAQFKTVLVSSTLGKISLESQILDDNVCTAGVSADGITKTETVDLVLSSRATSSATNLGLPVNVDYVTVTYSPNISKSTSTPPPLEPVVSNSKGIIPPGGSVTLPVEVANAALKEKLFTEKGYPLCSGTKWSYFATITINAVELGTDTRRQWTTGMDVTLSDL